MLYLSFFIQSQAYIALIRNDVQSFSVILTQLTFSAIFTDLGVLTLSQYYGNYHTTTM